MYKEALYGLGIVLILVIVSVGACLFIAVGACYYEGSRQATIYNALHGTTYTAGDFCWAKDQINSRTFTVK